MSARIDDRFGKSTRAAGSSATDPGSTTAEGKAARAVEGARAPELPEQPLVERAGRSFEALKVELARRQLRLLDAQLYAKNALAASPLRETHAEIEEAVNALLRACATGQRPDPRAVARLVSAAIEVGPAGVPEMIAALESQRAGIAAELHPPSRDGCRWIAKEEFTRLSEALFDAIAEKALEALAKRRPAASPDRSKAMRSMLAAADALSCGFSSFAIYPANRQSYSNANSFTNEPGFPNLTRNAGVQGGAAIGVGGAIFDLGSRGADLIISVDANPKQKDIIEVFCAVLLAVDRLCEKNGWDDTRRAEEVLGRLTGGGTEQTVAELEAVGLPGATRDNLEPLLTSVATKLAGKSFEFLPIPQDLWCRGADAPQRIAHLTRLALEGRILAVTADLADERVIDRINVLLDAHGTTAKVVHFSNALDYIADVGGVCSNFGRLHMHDTAVLTTSAHWLMLAGQRLGTPEALELTAALGTLEAPSALPAAEWLGAGKKGSRLHALAWEDPGHRATLLSYTKQAYGKYDLAAPATYEEHVAIVKKLTAELFADEAKASEQLKQRMIALGRWSAYALVAPEACDALLEQHPKDPQEASRIADAIDAEFWTLPRKTAFLEAKLRERNLEPTPGLEKHAKRCRTYEDLRDAELDLRRSSGALARA